MPKQKKKDISDVKMGVMGENSMHMYKCTFSTEPIGTSLCPFHSFLTWWKSLMAMELHDLRYHVPVHM